MFKRSMVLLFVMAFIAFSFSAAFSGERGFLRDLGKTAVAVEKSQSSCEAASKCGPAPCKMKAVKSQKCNMPDCKCLNCVCGDNCAKMNANIKNCGCEKAAVKKVENKNCGCENCVCAGGACSMKALACGDKTKSACGMSVKSDCKSGSCGEKSKISCRASDNSSCKSGSCSGDKMKSGKMNCKGGKCGK